MAEQKSELEENLRRDVQVAQRARDQVRLDTLRLALNAMHLEEVARTDAKNPQHGKPLAEADRFAILDKQIKQRFEAAQGFRAGNRLDRAEKEEREAAILKEYLPAQLSDDELRTLIAGLIAEHGKEFRKVMPVASRETKGRADGRHVSELVREMTA